METRGQKQKKTTEKGVEDGDRSTGETGRMEQENPESLEEIRIETLEETTSQVGIERGTDSQGNLILQMLENLNKKFDDDVRYKKLEELIKQGKEEERALLEQIKVENKEGLQKFKEEIGKKFDDHKMENIELIRQMGKTLENRIMSKEQQREKDMEDWKTSIERTIENRITEKVEETKMEVRGERRMEFKRMEEEMEIGCIQRNEGMKNKLKNMETKVLNEVEKQVQDLKEGYKKLQEEVEERIKEKTDSTYPHMQVLGSETVLPFTGIIKDNHPKVFWRSLKVRFPELNKGDNVLTERMKNSLRILFKDRALIWFDGKEDRFNKCKDMEESFMNYFWGPETQAIAREKLYQGAFDSNRNSSMNDYLMRMYNEVKYVEPRMTEGELIICLARHFDDGIRERIAINGIETIDELSNYFKRIDRSRRQEFNGRSRYEENFDNRPRGNNNQRNYNGFGRYSNRGENNSYNDRGRTESENRRDRYQGNRRFEYNYRGDTRNQGINSNVNNRYGYRGNEDNRNGRWNENYNMRGDQGGRYEGNGNQRNEYVQRRAEGARTEERNDREINNVQIGPYEERIGEGVNKEGSSGNVNF